MTYSLVIISDPLLTTCCHPRNAIKLTGFSRKDRKVAK